MRATEYRPIDIVKRTNRSHKTLHDRINLGVTVSDRPVEKEPGHFYALIKFPWSNDPIECNLRTIQPS
jgi:hypothetical protein